MKFVRVLFALHVLALIFGLAGMLIMMPHPEIWSGSAALTQVYTFGMDHGGATHILFGAATMIAFGLVTIGWRKTLIFLAAGTLIPLCAELLGTATGWPFGGYSYTDFLGFKLAGRVPYSVPLSWYYMGFASYLLAAAILARGNMRYRSVATVVLGAWLLMSWDLVLDPAMASANIPIHFWIWREAGAYFGMPVRNLVGWFGTGVVFMTVGRLLWREDVPARSISPWLPFGVYAVNVIWAMVLSMSVGLWLALLAAGAFGLIPASLAWIRGESGQIRSGGLTRRGQPASGSN